MLQPQSLCLFSRRIVLFVTCAFQLRLFPAGNTSICSTLPVPSITRPASPALYLPSSSVIFRSQLPPESLPWLPDPGEGFLKEQHMFRAASPLVIYWLVAPPGLLAYIRLTSPCLIPTRCSIKHYFLISRCQNKTFILSSAGLTGRVKYLRFFKVKNSRSSGFIHIP